jgi:hypothetical protein
LDPQVANAAANLLNNPDNPLNAQPATNTNGRRVGAPSTLPLFGACVFFAYSRRLRNRISEPKPGKITPAISHS